MSRRCRHCLSGTLIKSIIRWYDVPRLMVLRRPYRCPYCGKRQSSYIVPYVGRIVQSLLVAATVALIGVVISTGTFDVTEIYRIICRIKP